MDVQAQLNRVLTSTETKPEDIPLVREFHDLLNEFAAMASIHGTQVAPCKGSYPMYFALLDFPFRQRIYNHFLTYVECCREFVASGISLRDDRQLLWCIIKKLNLRPSSDLFTELQDSSDVIEIYDTIDFVQIFRNFRFYDVCSYSMDEILSRPWWELYYRDQDVTNKIQAVVEQAVSSRSTDLVWYDAGIHIMNEIDSPSLNQCLIENRFLAPLLDNQRRMAAGVNVVRPLSVNRRRDTNMIRTHAAPRIHSV